MGLLRHPSGRQRAAGCTSDRPTARVRCELLSPDTPNINLYSAPPSRKEADVPSPPVFLPAAPGKTNGTREGEAAGDVNLMRVKRQGSVAS